ncbi:hypothetical protein [Xanthomonas oryzae]|uniref:hypothetical protein n=1 Tax=Xanthomonas oryzae TaxID=347 RepID=UPI000AA2347D|nr:hypothetical protein [Xanthomonas oryzae]QBH01707.1 hypothetical protein EYC56_24020 [Xanthomonas oryzae]QBI14066.1 hypothetical protein EYR02_22185 [Xanthomonas oryzae pv. oryzae]QBI16784.1 hypothetical protein EYR03_16060 [Xanthomonas oryzae pv. oryzae]QBI17682.1 hypothetical protein EYR03_22470 [Xanthomonas oryzae pv. oryzae]TAO92485.1 hypothetical protein EYR05_15880 [Xanthomonas oryzae pv. oryzae]
MKSELSLGNQSALSNKSSGKMKVLALQELEGVSGGEAAWSTDSVSCAGVTNNQWSTGSHGCARETTRSPIGGGGGN